MMIFNASDLQIEMDFFVQGELYGVMNLHTFGIVASVFKIAMI